MPRLCFGHRSLESTAIMIGPMRLRGIQTSESRTVELTILMPCLNEAETVATCVRKARGFLERTGIEGEVLVADNGSSDGSIEIAREAGARVVQIADKGYGNALIGGIGSARGRFVIMADADDSYDFSQLDAFVEGLRAGNTMVIGHRFRGGIRPGAMPLLHRYLGNPALSFAGRLFFSSGVGDFHCGLRGVDRASTLRLGLSSPGMEFASEMVVKATLAGWALARAASAQLARWLASPPISTHDEPTVADALSRSVLDWNRRGCGARDPARADNHRRRWFRHSHHALRRRCNHPRSAIGVVLGSGTNHRRIEKSPAYVRSASALSAFLYA